MTSCKTIVHQYISMYIYYIISFHCLSTQHHIPGDCLHFLHWISGVKTGHHRIDSAHRQMPLAICKIKLPAVLQISWVLTLETAQQPWRHGRLTSATGWCHPGALFNGEKYLTPIHEYSIFGSKSLSSMCCSLWQSCLRLWRWFTSTSSLLTFGPQICSQGRVKRQESASFITIAPQELMTKLFGFRLGTHTFED